MEIGVQLWGVLKDPKVNTLETLRILRSLGFRSIEPCIALGTIFGLEHVIWPLQWFRAQASEIAAIGLENTSCHIFSDDIAEEADAATSLAKEYGIHQFVVKSPRTLTEKNLVDAATSYMHAADRLANAGAELLIHNECEDIITKLAGKTAYEHLLDLCSGKVGAQIDVGWVYAAGEDPEAFLLRNAERVKSIHFKDFLIKDNQMTEVAPGAGMVDTSACLRFARAKECDQVIDMDVFPNGMNEELSTAIGALNN